MRMPELRRQRGGVEQKFSRILCVTESLSAIIFQYVANKRHRTSPRVREVRGCGIIPHPRRMWFFPFMCWGKWRQKETTAITGVGYRALYELMSTFWGLLKCKNSTDI